MSDMSNKANHPIVRAVERSKVIYEYLAALDARLDGTVLEHDWACLLDDVGTAVHNPNGSTHDALFVALRRFQARPPAKPDAALTAVVQHVADALQEGIDALEREGGGPVVDVITSDATSVLVEAASGKRYRVVVREVEPT